MGLEVTGPLLRSGCPYGRGRTIRKPQPCEKKCVRLHTARACALSRVLVWLCVRVRRVDVLALTIATFCHRVFLFRFL